MDNDEDDDFDINNIELEPKKKNKPLEEVEIELNLEDLITLPTKKFIKRPLPKGTKRCPKCAKIIGARALVCPKCDVELVKGGRDKLEKRRKYIANLAIDPTGYCPRNRKVCPGCKRYVKRKVRKCPACNFEFSFGKSIVIRDGNEEIVVKVSNYIHPPEPDLVYRRRGYKGIFTPAEKCPYRMPSDITQESISDWVEVVRSVGYDRGVNYYPRALKYFARQTYYPENPIYKNVCEFIDQAYKASL